MREFFDTFDTYVQRCTNTVFERFQFFKLEQKSESIDKYILEVRKQAVKCDFHIEEQDKLIRDQLVLDVNDTKLQEELLRDQQLNLDVAINK